MTTEQMTVQTWQDTNRRHLAAALDRVRRSLQGEKAESAPDQPSDAGGHAPLSTAPALERLCTVFGLSPFERDILVLCAGVELDASFARLCGSAQGDELHGAPTFSLALSTLADPHWNALTPAAPLRHWRLLEIGGGAALTTSPLRIDERVLHYLVGVDYLDEHLEGLVEVLPEPDETPSPSLELQAERVAAVWRRYAEATSLPPIQLIGEDAAGQQSVAHAACSAFGLQVRRISAQSLPSSQHELETLLRLWQREAVLTGCALLVDCHDLDGSDPQRQRAVNHVIETLRGALIVTTRLPLPRAPKPLVTFEVQRPPSHEQASLWRDQLGSGVPETQIDELVAQFQLSAPEIHAVARSAEGEAGPDSELWQLCRSQTRPRLESLAQRVEAQATWEHLVLPEAQVQMLHQVALHVRQRGTVYDRWGFASRYSRGLGISVLAAGPSGTGKTMAAEVLANELRLDLYHIDLSQVVSKYIGETERNLARLFDAAEGGGAVLLFDEADALFGKRTEVKDSHDRFANIEVSYLLQRMEAYRGLAILTTNMRDALDPAFLRRIRFVVQFPFPDETARARIWRGVFPAATPRHSLDFEKLARLNLAGGNIRNVAMNAAFLAAEEKQSVTMRHIAAAARAELLKIDRPMAEAELATWT